ncbi:MAG TPA: type II secretion system ATPase GspE [bacterium]|nr:type II secretion system ATPase GspE [bacterium]
MDLPTIDGVTVAEYKARVGLSVADHVLEDALRYHEARSIAQRGPVDDAIAAHKGLLEILPEEPWIYEDLAALYGLRGSTREAIVVLLTLADLYLLQGRTDAVLRTYHQAAALAPGDPEVQARLASPLRSPPSIPAPPTAPPAGSASAPVAPTRAGPPRAAPAPPQPAREAPPPTKEAPTRESLPEGRGREEERAEAPEGRPGKRGARAVPRKAESLGQVLQQMGLVGADQLTQALEIQSRTGEKLGQVLIDLKVITEVQLAEAMGRQWGYRYVSLADVRIDPDAVKLVPHSLALRLHVIPITWEHGRLVLAMTDPLNVIAVDDVRLITGQEVEPVITTEDELMAAINRHYQVETAMDAPSRGAMDDLAAEVGEDEVSVEQLKALVEDAPVVRLLNMIIDDAVREGASDIHVEPQRNGVLVRYRIDGVLHDVMKPARNLRAPLISRAKIMADLDIAERRRPQDGRIHLRSNGRTLDLRVSTLPTIFGEKVVMRLLDQATPLIGLNRLGFHSETLRQWEQAISTPYGMLLVTGPTGSGKTTTLYATLGTINTLEKNIVTIEDPVEYQLPRINQVQVNVRAGLTFAGGLRSILRQDPDIVMVGEMRDRETAEVGIQSALTGHLVLSTLHTNDAATAITRLTDMGIEPFLISSSLLAILAQRLARQICPHCKIAYVPPPDALKRLGLEASKENIQLFRGQGCEECRFTGYRGRIGVFELLVLSDTIREMVVRRLPSPEIKAQAVREGMQTLRDDGLEKVLSGVSTIDEILRVVYVAE